MVARGHMLINATGNYIHYISISENSNLYKVQIDCLAIPAALPVGWAYLAGSSPAWVCNGKTPQLRIPNQGVSSLFGIGIGYYPSTLLETTNQSFISTSIPRMEEVQSIIIHCSVIMNGLSAGSQMLYSYSSSAQGSWGSGYSIEPKFPRWLEATSGLISSINIRFTDQLFRALPMIDSDITLSLFIKGKNE
jgi:hypothetical protein